tara:strand:- start:731 stop:1096 length:366 start_codon:yes stop_codon:yes gene_type:complete
MSKQAIIHITDLKVDVLIGIYDAERKQKQPLIFELIMHYDATAACQSDHGSDVVDYWSISKRIIHIAQSSHFQLVESLANQLLDNLMQDTKIQYAKLSISKPKALEAFGAQVAVMMERMRD